MVTFIKCVTNINISIIRVIRKWSASIIQLIKLSFKLNYKNFEWKIYNDKECNIKFIYVEITRVRT